MSIIFQVLAILVELRPIFFENTARIRGLKLGIAIILLKDFDKYLKKHAIRPT